MLDKLREKILCAQSTYILIQILVITISILIGVGLILGENNSNIYKIIGIAIIISSIILFIAKLKNKFD